MIKLITFDLDDTLWDNMPVLIRAEQKTWQRLNDYWPQIHKQFDPKEIFEYRLKLREEQPELKYRITELRQHALKKMLLVSDCPETQAENIAKKVMGEFMEWRHEVKCFPEVRPVLSHLSAQFTLGAITNGNVNIQQLDDIKDYFSFSIKAEDHDSIKPEATLFLKAMELAGVAPEETLHVGDSLKADVAGAAALNIQTVWFNPHDEDLPEGVRPNYIIRSLTGLFRILDPEMSEAVTN